MRKLIVRDGRQLQTRMTQRIEEPSPIGNRAQRRAHKAGATGCPYTEAELERSQRMLEKLFGFREE